MLRTLSDASKNCGVKKDSPEGLKLFASLVYSLLSKGSYTIDKDNFFAVPDAINNTMWSDVHDEIFNKGNGGA